MANIKVNIKDLKNYANQLKKLNKSEIDKFCEASVKELAARLLRKVKMITPEGQYPAGSGKTGGTLRREWTVGEVQKTEDGFTIEVINPMEYASYVEFGHVTRNRRGWVVGRFMLTKSEIELEAAMPSILENKLKKFIEGVFND